MKLVFDLETLPDQRVGAFDTVLAETVSNFKAPSTLTKEQAAIDLGLTDKDEIKFTSKDTMIKRWESELASAKAQDVAMQTYRKTALDGSKGSIFCIGYAFDDLEPICEVHDNERDAITSFYCAASSAYDGLRPIEIIGHNVLDFDLRFLFQRAVVLGIRPPSCLNLNPSRYDKDVFDTMQKWVGHGNRISLDNLCKALDVPTPKSEITGANVYDYWLRGEGESIAEYCKKDVEATRQVYKRMTFQG
jgi:DNA polymerase elongation subunit (family B)